MVNRRITLDDFLICEDIRREKNGVNTLVGVVERIMQVPILPVVLPRLAFFIGVSDLPPGNYSYTLSILDEVLSKTIVSVEQELSHPEGVERGAVRFLIQLGQVEFRSWGSYKCTLDIKGICSFDRKLCLRPPDWNMLYLRCTECDRLVPSGIAVAQGKNVDLKSNNVQCPACRHVNAFAAKDVVRIEKPQHTVGDRARDLTS